MNLSLDTILNLENIYIYGKVGTGKTTLAHKLRNSLQNVEVVEEGSDKCHPLFPFSRKIYISQLHPDIILPKSIVIRMSENYQASIDTKSEF